VGAGAEALAVLSAHKVAGLSDSATALATEGAVSHLKFRYFKDPILDSVPNAGFAASPATIAAKGDLLRRYARALVKASIIIRENPALAAHYALLGESLGTKETPETLRIATDEMVALRGHLIGGDPMNPRIGETPQSGIALYCQMLYNSGLAVPLVPAAAVVTNQFVAFANDFDHKAWVAEVRKMR
jgi:hypothetical protein